MRVTDEMVEAAARAQCASQGGYDPDEKMANDGPRWHYYVPLARAALEAALAVEGTPKVKALEWKKDWRGDLDDIPTWRAETPVGRLSFSVHGYASHDAAPIERTEAAKAEVQADYEKRVLSCLEYTTPPAGIREALEELPDYDAGLLNDYGGGNVEWWWDYLRAEIDRANGYWRDALRGQS